MQGLSLDGVEPKDENVADNSWTIWAYEHMYTQKDAKKEVLDFVEYMKSKDVQENVIKELGYISMADMKVERDMEGNIK